MMLIQRNSTGQIIDELCPRLYSLVLIDQSSSYKYSDTRAEVLDLIKYIARDRDLNSIIRIACSFSSSLESEQVSFCQSAYFRFGMPAVSRAPLRATTLDYATKLLMNASNDSDFFGSRCTVPILAIVSENSELTSPLWADATTSPFVIASARSASLSDFFSAVLDYYRQAIENGVIR